MVTRGPRAADETLATARHRALSAASRVRILELVRSSGGMTAAQVAEETGMHPSTVRAHLEQLAESGLLSRHRHGDGSPGRPAWRYQATVEVDAVAGPPADRPYHDLAAALIAHLARDADDPHAAGVRAGRDWGRSLAAPLGRVEPIDGVRRVLDGLGFDPRIAERPEPGSAVLQLRACPFLDLALRSPDVVCGLHQGVIAGALGALGASTAGTELEPFAAPGACIVRVRTRARASGAEPKP